MRLQVNKSKFQPLEFLREFTFKPVISHMEAKRGVQAIKIRYQNIFDQVLSPRSDLLEESREYEE